MKQSDRKNGALELAKMFSSFIDANAGKRSVYTLNVIA